MYLGLVETLAVCEFGWSCSNGFLQGCPRRLGSVTWVGSFVSWLKPVNWHCCVLPFNIYCESFGPWHDKLKRFSYGLWRGVQWASRLMNTCFIWCQVAGDTNKCCSVLGSDNWNESVLLVSQLRVCVWWCSQLRYKLTRDCERSTIDQFCQS